jgi:hypothetical protein
VSRASRADPGGHEAPQPAPDAPDPHGPRRDPRRRGGDRQPRAEGRPYDEATLDHLLHTNRDELAAWLDDRRTLGQLARKRGFHSHRALAKRLVAARGGHMSPALRRTLERRALDTLTQAHLARHVLFHIYHSPAVGTSAHRLFGVSTARYKKLRDSGLSPRRIAAAGGRTEAQLRRSLLALFAERGRRAVHIGAVSPGHGRRVHAPPVPDHEPAARLRRARVPPSRGPLGTAPPRVDPRA